MQLQFLWIFPGTYQLCERKIMRFFRGKENNGLFTITGEKLTGVIFGSCFNPWRFAIRHGLWDRATPLPRLWWRRSGNPGEPNKINNLENHWTILSWSSLWSYSSLFITLMYPKTSQLLASPAFFWMSLAVIPASWKEEAAKVGFCKSVTRPCGCMICMYMYQYISISLSDMISVNIYYIYISYYVSTACMYGCMDGCMHTCMYR